MASSSDTNSPAEYHAPPRKWPFPLLGRNAFLIGGLALLALILFPFWGSIAVAAVFAFGLIRPFDKVCRYLGNRRKLLAGLLVGLMTVLLLFPATLLSYRVYDIVTAPKDQNASGVFSKKTAEHFDKAYSKLEEMAVKYGVGAKVFENGGDAKNSLRDAAANGVTQGLAIVSAMLVSLPEITVSLIVFAIFLYGFLAHPKEIRGFAFRLHLFRPADLRRSISILKTSSYDSLVANFVVGAMQASIIAFGAKFLGYNEFVLIFSAVFVVSFIPFIGAAPVGYVIALFMALNEGSTPALIMAAIATFTGIVDNVVRPYLVSSGKTEISPILSFAAILGAIGIMGLKGIFLGPVILTSTVAFLGAAKEKNEPKKKGTLISLFKRFSKNVETEFKKVGS